MSSSEPTAQDALNSANAEITQIDRIKRLQILGSEGDVLTACRLKLRALSDSLRQALAATGGDADTPAKAFRAWRKSPEGEQLWNAYTDIKRKYPDPAVPRPAAAPATPVAWTATCDTVWADMTSRFDNWRSGAATNRGHWWGGPPNGGTGDGVTTVPDSVIDELAKRIGDRPSNVNRESWWRLEDSDSGGLAFHRTSRGEDFIYHLSL